MTEVTTKQAAKELGMSVLTVQHMMRSGRLRIGVALKREGCARWSYYIFRHALDEEKRRLLGCTN